MRIGVDCYPLRPHVGGIKHYFLTLFEELLEHDRANEYVFFTHAHNAPVLAELRCDRWKTASISLSGREAVSDHLGGLDLYFCPFSALYPRPVPKPSVVTLPDIQEAFLPGLFSLPELKARDLERVSSTRIADRVITHSEFSKRTLIEHHRVGPQRVLVARHGVDERYRRASEIGRPPSAPLPTDFILYPANLWKHKNHDRLLQALRRLKDARGLTVHAVFTGDPEERDGYALGAGAAEHGVAAQVRHLGLLPVEELAYLYRHARMLVFPSLFEGFGLPLVEAMASGCPVVAADATAVPEVLSGAGELFDPTSVESIAAAIEKVWTSAPVREQLIVKGKARAAGFSPAASAHAHLAAFEGAAGAFSYARYAWNLCVYERLRRLSVEARWRWAPGPRVS